MKGNLIEKTTWKIRMGEKKEALKKNINRWERKKYRRMRSHHWSNLNGNPITLFSWKWHQQENTIRKRWEKLQKQLHRIVCQAITPRTSGRQWQTETQINKQLPYKHHNDSLLPTANTLVTG